MRTLLIVAFVLFVLSGGCAGSAPSAESSRKGGTQPASRLVDAQQAERLRRIMVPLAGAMNHPRPLNQIRVAIMDDPRVNAASAGGGEFYVTMGLLLKASDDQLRGVLAHELAHDDLGHVAKAQTLGAGVGVGVIVLDQLFPGSGSFTPLAGALITSGYSRQEEYDADRHGVNLLRGAGYYRVVMIDTLTWLLQTEGASGGGFLASHPGTQDRVDALKKL